MVVTLALSAVGFCAAAIPSPAPGGLFAGAVHTAIAGRNDAPTPGGLFAGNEHPEVRERGEAPTPGGLLTGDVHHNVKA